MGKDDEIDEKTHLATFVWGFMGKRYSCYLNSAAGGIEVHVRHSYKHSKPDYTWKFVDMTQIKYGMIKGKKDAGKVDVVLYVAGSTKKIRFDDEENYKKFRHALPYKI